MNTKEITLKNGLKTLLLHAPGNSYATVQIWFRAGSALENEKEKGIAHFLEHMFFKGTAKRPGSKIAYEIESFGGEVNAFTSFDYTCYYINCPSIYIEKSADVLLDMVTQPLFKESDLLPERSVVHEEYLRSLDNNHQFSFQKMQEDLFLPPYHSPILGSEKHIKSFSLKLLKDFRNKYYHTQNAMLVIAGDIKNEKRLTGLISKYKLPAGRLSPVNKFQTKKKSSISIHTKDVNMEQLSILIPAPAYLTNAAPIEDLALSTFGHGETSRLYHDLVLVAQDANSAHASTMFMKDGGTHVIRMSYPTKNRTVLFNKLKKILSAALTDGFKEDELERIKSQYLSSKIYEKESLESFAFSLGHSFAQAGDIHSEEKFLETIKSTSLLRVNRALKEIFERQIHIAVQLPKDENKKMAKSDIVALQKDLLTIGKRVRETAKQKEIETSKIDPQVKLYDLGNGTKLIYRQNSVTPTFVLHAYLRGGITEETNESNGIYHLLSGLLAKGYDGIEYETMKGEIEQCSASLGGFSGKNAYGILMHAQSEHINRLLPHFFGSLLKPDISERFIDHEKELTKRSIVALLKDPVRTCFREASKLIFAPHPYSLDALGTEEILNKISRSELLKLHQDNITNKELLLTYCGDLQLDDLLFYLKPFLTSLPIRESIAPLKKPIPANFGVHKTIKFDREQTHLFLLIPTGPMVHEVNVALKVVTTYLMGQSSPLFVDVRDKKGLCYSAQPVHFTALEGGYFGIYIATAPEKKEKATEALLLLLNSIKSGGIKKREYNRIKEMIHCQDLVNIQTNDDYANLYSIPVLQDLGLDFYHQSNQSVQKLKHEQFQKIISKILDVDWNIISVGREI